VAVLDFTTYGLQPTLPISIVNLDTGLRSNVTILNVTTGSMFLVGAMANITLGANISITYYDYNNPAYLDTNIQSFYRDSALGTRAEDIDLDGGGYYDVYSSHAPEELIPGVTFDSLNMMVYTQTGNANVGYRVVHNMSANAASVSTQYWPQYYAIFSANTTALSANLNITDSNVYVTSTAGLATPLPQYTQPGVIYVNGEKITYYTIDRVNNVLGQIRRAVDGTGAPTVHPAGTAVVESSVNQLIPTSTTPSANVHLGSWLNLKVAANISLLNDNLANDIVDNLADNISSYPQDLQEFLTLSTNATVYAGNTITQLSTGASGVVAANSTGTTVTLWAANVSGAFSANISANTYVYRNGANLSAKTTDISYNAVDGTGLAGSNTAQAVFIRQY
jgi:hypothetical protein